MPVFAAGADRQSREVTKQRVQVAQVSVGLTKCACMHACRCAGGNECCQNVTAFLQRLGEGARCEVG